MQSISSVKPPCTTTPSTHRRPGRILVVSRHQGAVEWIRAQLGGQKITVVAHLDDASFAAGDAVCGVLPLVWAARICAAGAEALALTVDMPEPLRGCELTAADLRRLGARLVRFQVRILE